MVSTINDYKIGRMKKDADFYYFAFGETDNGACFKDQDAYDNHYDRPCYVPEYASEDKKTWNTGWDVITERNNPIEENVFYTHNDILKIAKDFFEHYKHDYTENGIMSPEELADITFEDIDWQSPDTYMTELTY